MAARGSFNETARGCQEKTTQTSRSFSFEVEKEALFPV